MSASTPREMPPSEVQPTAAHTPSRSSSLSLPESPMQVPSEPSVSRHRDNTGCHLTHTGDTCSRIPQVRARFCRYAQDSPVAFRSRVRGSAPLREAVMRSERSRWSHCFALLLRHTAPPTCTDALPNLATSRNDPQTSTPSRTHACDRLAVSIGATASKWRAATNHRPCYRTREFFCEPESPLCSAPHPTPRGAMRTAGWIGPIDLPRTSVSPGLPRGPTVESGTVGTAATTRMDGLLEPLPGTRGHYER